MKKSRNTAPLNKLDQDKKKWNVGPGIIYVIDQQTKGIVSRENCFTTVQTGLDQATNITSIRFFFKLQDIFFKNI